MTARYVLRPSAGLPIVYLYRNTVDYRKGHRGLLVIVQIELGDQFSLHCQTFSEKVLAILLQALQLLCKTIVQTFLCRCGFVYTTETMGCGKFVRPCG